MFCKKQASRMLGRMPQPARVLKFQGGECACRKPDKEGPKCGDITSISALENQSAPASSCQWRLSSGINSCAGIGLLMQ